VRRSIPRAPLVKRKLTARQRELLELLAEGYSYREIGRRMQMRADTACELIGVLAARVPVNGLPLLRPRQRLLHWWLTTKPTPRKMG